MQTRNGNSRIPVRKGTEVRSQKVKAFPCGRSQCKKGVVGDGIQCEACEKWFHNRCSMITPKGIALYTQYECIRWVCNQCVRVIKETQSGSLEVGEKEDVQKPVEEDTTGEGSRLGGLSEETDNVGAQERKRGRNRRENITLQECAGGVEDLSRELREIRDRLKANEEALERLLRDKEMVVDQLKNLQANSDLALGRNRNVVIKGIPEPYMKEGRQRERAVRYHLNTILRMVGMPPGILIKRTLRLGKWGEGNPAGGDTRPVVVEFANPRHRDRVLAASADIMRKTSGRFRVEPDDAAGWRVNGRGQVADKSMERPGQLVVKVPRVTAATGTWTAPSAEEGGKESPNEKGNKRASEGTPKNPGLMKQTRELEGGIAKNERSPRA